jgi:histidinol-phosphatase
MSRWSKELGVAAKAAMQAAELALRLQGEIVAETKADTSPVTQADRECERLIARLLNEAFPADGFLGEEGVRVQSSNGRRWIIDPIDGTRDYVRRDPLWANLIALEADGDVVVGVVNLPLLGRIYTGSRGAGAFCNDDAIHASSKTRVEDSVLCFNAFNRVHKLPPPDRLIEWMSRFWSVRGLGGAADAMMVAAGEADVWIEPIASTWDFAPHKIVLEEAGARYFNFDGGNSIYAGNCIACAPGLEKEVRRFLGVS